MQITTFRFMPLIDSTAYVLTNTKLEIRFIFFDVFIYLLLYTPTYNKHIIIQDKYHSCIRPILQVSSTSYSETGTELNGIQ